MADIKLSPEQLLAQSMEMTALQTEYESLFSQVTNVLNGINNSWSEKLASNFSGKIQSAQKSFSSIGNMLMNGSAAAKLSSMTFSSGCGISEILSGLFGESTLGTGLFSNPSELAKMIQEAGDKLNGESSAWIGEMLGMGSDVETIKEATELVMNGDYEGALKLAYEKGLDWTASALAGGIPEGSWVETLEEATGGTLGLANLEKDFFKNWMGGTLGKAGEIVQNEYSGNADPVEQLKLLGEMAWNFSAGAVIDTTSDAAFDVVKNIPIIGEYYADQGATDGASAIGVMLGDLTNAMTGNSEDAAYVKNYYSDHGGIARGIVDGVVDIAGYVKDQAAPVIQSAWSSVFGK